MAKRTVVIGMLGTHLDRAGSGKKRWERWRPTVDICRQDDLHIDRLVLLYPPDYQALLEQTVADIRVVSPDTQVDPIPLAFDDPWDFEEVYATLLDFALGYRFRTDRERYLVHMTTGTHVAQICWFLLTESRYLPSELLQASPPPRGTDVGPHTIIDLDLSKYDRIARRFRRESEDAVSFLKSGIDTRNHAFNALIERIEKVAVVSSAPILLTGPTGAGKSQLARRIYALKQARRRLQGAFVEVNCATLRGDTASSTLFGHKKGAFTGAVADRPGLLRAADGGLLFLDEIGELGVDEQAMLLRALEERRFLPLGADREASSNFQLIAGTNRDLERSVSAGRFREDLLARINLWTFRLPGLADRREDIEPNLNYELERLAEAEGHRTSFNREALRKFLAFARSPGAAWRRNFRDFNAAVIRMATLAPGGRIDVPTVNEEIERLQASWQPVEAETSARDIVARHLGSDVSSSLDRFDRVQLADVLKVCEQAASMSEAGRQLFSVSRTKRASTNDSDRLRKYLRRFGLSFEKIRHP